MSVKYFHYRAVTFLLIFIALFAIKVNAQESQFDDDFYMILGLGTGMFSFTAADSARGEQQVFAPTGDNVVSGGDSTIEEVRLVQYWIELYYGSFGIGWRRMNIFQSNGRRMYVVFSEPLTPGISSEGIEIVDSDAYIGQRIEVNHNFLTGQYWFPVNQSGSIRFGLFAGVGTTDYESEYYWVAKNTNSSDYSEENRYSETYKTSGSSTLLGGFFDLTSGIFGARIGWQQISSDLDDFGVDGPGVNSLGADVSGALIFADISIRF